MIGPILSIFSGRCYRPRLLFRFLVHFTKLIYRLRRKTFSIDRDRFEAAAWVAKFSETKSGQHERSIELVVVSTSKDFDILPDSVNYARKALAPYQVTSTRIIVPNHDILSLKQMQFRFECPIEIIDESTLVSIEQFRELSETFRTRDTWVLQQLLKVQAVLNAKSDAVLILDSDTVLLRQRPWFSVDGSQILMPSMEYNAPYYQFLEKLKISSNVPEFTFISHHMLMQPTILSQALESCGLLNVNDLIKYICENSDKSVQSPICIEYELYGQYLYQKNPKEFFLERWSNLSISRQYSRRILRSRIAKFVLRIFYNSISFHSWS
jgi:hypothetical protein